MGSIAVPAPAAMSLSCIVWLLDANTAVKVPGPLPRKQGLKFLFGEHGHSEFSGLIEF